MRVLPVLLLAAAVTAATTVSANAGTVATENGRFMWQSTQCVEPTMPPSLAAAGRDSQAGNMNTYMENYNAYSDNMQAYMNCVSKEAETDSASVNQAIQLNAQNTIAAAKVKVDALHASMQPKK